MAELIPFETQIADDLNARFAETPFRSTDDFINFYNSGLINKTAEQVAGFAAEVDSTFKNVKLQSKNLVFISKEEVELDEALTELKKWDVLVKVKGRLEDLKAEKSVKSDTVIGFSDESPGVLFVVKSSENGESEERLLDEKFFKPAEDWLAEALHAEHSSLPDQPGRFLVSDFLSLEVGFVSQIHSILFGE